MVLFVYFLVYLFTNWIQGMELGNFGTNTLKPMLWGFNFLIGTLFGILFKNLLKVFKRTKLMSREYINNYMLNRISGFCFVEDEVMYGFARWNHETVAKNWYNSVFVGAGYRQYSQSGSFAYFMVLYNLTWGFRHDQNSNAWDTPYYSPIEFRVGYCFGK